MMCTRMLHFNLDLVCALQNKIRTFVNVKSSSWDYLTSMLVPNYALKLMFSNKRSLDKFLNLSK